MDNDKSRLRLVVLAVTSLALGLGLYACGAAPNYYNRSITKQEKCCNSVAEPNARSACLAEIKHADSPAVATSRTNEETYACVDRYFVCDPQSGHETKESAQAQLDCINGLEGSQPAAQ
jgi:hypothetical protein